MDLLDLLLRSLSLSLWLYFLLLSIFGAGAFVVHLILGILAFLTLAVVRTLRSVVVALTVLLQAV